MMTSKSLLPYFSTLALPGSKSTRTLEPPSALSADWTADPHLTVPASSESIMIWRSCPRSTSGRSGPVLIYDALLLALRTRARAELLRQARKLERGLSGPGVDVEGAALETRRAGLLALEEGDAVAVELEDACGGEPAHACADDSDLVLGVAGARDEVAPLGEDGGEKLRRRRHC
ncbi:hypothetical protein B0H14DRAFT_2788319, partial [Mycena olivaceomarginata]